MGKQVKSHKKDIMTLVIGKILQVILALVSIKVLTSVLTEQEIGRYYILLTILTLFNFSFLNPLGQYFGRHVVGWSYSGKLATATNILIIIRLIAISIAVIFAYVIFHYFSYDRYYGLSEFLLFVFFALLAGTYLVLLNAINTLGRRVIFIKYFISTLFLGLIFSILITKYISASGIGWLYGVALSQVIFLFSAYKNIMQGSTFSLIYIQEKLNIIYFKKIALFIAPITLTLFLQWGQNSSYRFIIEDKYSIETLAYIAVGFSVSGAIFLAVESLITQYSNPIYFKSITNSVKDIRVKSWNNLANVVLPIYFCLTVFVISLSPYLINILVAEKFHGAYIYVALGAFIEFFRVSTNVVYLISQSEVKTNTTIVPYGIGFISTVLALSFIDLSERLWLIPVVLGLSYSFIFISLYFSMKKILPVKIYIIPILKSVIMSMPFVVVPLLNLNPSIFLSLVFVFVAGVYFIFCVYLFTHQKFRPFTS